MKNQKGFTLIELLVVVAIIGCLATIYYGKFKQRQKDRDAKRIAELKNMQRAVILYIDQCGEPPINPHSYAGGSETGSWDTSSDGLFMDFLKHASGSSNPNNTNFANPPLDPINETEQNCGPDPFSKFAYCYHYYTTCQGGWGYPSDTHYRIGAKLESTNKNYWVSGSVKSCT